MYHFGDSEQNTDWLKPQGSPAQLRDLLAADLALLEYYQKEDGDPALITEVEKRIASLREQLKPYETDHNYPGDGSGEPGADSKDSPDL